MKARGHLYGCSSVLFLGKELPWCLASTNRDSGAPTGSTGVVTGDSDPLSHTRWSLRLRHHLIYWSAKYNLFTLPLTVASPECRLLVLCWLGQHWEGDTQRAEEGAGCRCGARPTALPAVLGEQMMMGQSCPPKPHSGCRERDGDHASRRRFEADQPKRSEQGF